VNFEVIRDIILGTGEPTVMVHTERKIKRKRMGGEGTVSIITGPEDMLYRISYFKRQRLADNTSTCLGINRGGKLGKGAFYRLTIHV